MRGVHDSIELSSDMQESKREVTFAEGTAFARSEGCLFVETSAKVRENAFVAIHSIECICLVARVHGQYRARPSSVCNLHKCIHVKS